MGRYIRGKIEKTLDLGTLAGETLISTLVDGAVVERTLISSVVASYALSDLTPGGSVGPIVVRIAHSDYTDAEIEAFIENSGSWSEANKTAQEIGQRKIRTVGIFPDGESASTTSVLNHGNPIKTKLNWILTVGQTIRIWAFNKGTAALSTTDPDVSVMGHANLFPK